MVIAFTWNMQGAKSHGENRWSSDVRSFFVHKANVALLQECGAPPEGTPMFDVPKQAWVKGTNPPANVAYTQGIAGSERSPLYLFHAYWDDGGNRNNLAIMSTSEQGPLVTVDNPLNPGKRPLIGAVIEGRLYATIHAFSGSGNDGPRFVTAMPDLAKAAGVGSWFIAGDFNRDPKDYIHQLKNPVWSSGSATRRNPRSELDYGIGSFGWEKGNRPTVSEEPYSDHLSVQFHLP